MTTVDDCPFCLKNDKVKVIAIQHDGYLVKALDRDGNIVSGRYLIIPRCHVTKLEDLPEGWWTTIVQLIQHIPELVSCLPYNLSINIGEGAGQRVEHLHFWVVVRTGEEGLSSHGLGLSGLINLINFLPRESASRF
jgi:diadenosine tetraphosphate (Ap4A) HIT family hydrolase